MVFLAREKTHATNNKQNNTEKIASNKRRQAYHRYSTSNICTGYGRGIITTEEDLHQKDRGICTSNTLLGGYGSIEVGSRGGDHRVVVYFRTFLPKEGVRRGRKAKRN